MKSISNNNAQISNFPVILISLGVATIIFVIFIVIIQETYDAVDKSYTYSQTILLNNGTSKTLDTSINSNFVAQLTNDTWIRVVPNETNGTFGDSLVGNTTTNTYNMAGSNLTISLWVNTYTQVNSLNVIIGWGANPFPEIQGTGTPWNSWGVYIGNMSSSLDTRACFFRKSGNIASNSTLGGNTNFTCTTGNLVGTGWQHIVAVYNGTHMMIYRNGTLEGINNMSGDQSNSLSSKLYISSSSTFNSIFQYQSLNASVDEVRIYKDYLNTTQIQSLYSENRKGEQTLSLVPFSWYSFNENSGVIQYDRGSNGYNLTFSPFPQVYGSGYQNDGITTTLSNINDYTLSGTTFTLKNILYSWTGISSSWITGTQSITEDVNNTLVGIGTFGKMLSLIVVAIVAALVISIIFGALGKRRR